MRAVPGSACCLLQIKNDTVEKTMTQLMKSTSRLAIAAMAGVLATSVNAADLGGNCCADLEERVAELEATTARKGNRKVSLQIYGQVSESVIYWNDGAEGNVYVQENNAVQNRVGFTGGAKITSDWSAGYKLELQIRSYRSSAANQLSQGEVNGVNIAAYNTQSVALREANWWLHSATWGRVTVGRSISAVTGTSTINLAQTDGFQASGANMGQATQGFFMRRSGAGNAGNKSLSAITFGGFAYMRNGDSPAGFDYAQTTSSIKYTSPFFLGQSKSSGFQFSADWGQDDAWSSALRFVEDYGIFRFAAGVGYFQHTAGGDRGHCANASTANPSPDTTHAAAGAAAGGTTQGVSRTHCDAWQASASLMHAPTGLYMSGGGGWINDSERNSLFNITRNTAAGAGSTDENPRNLAKVDDQDNWWWIQAGWEAKLNSLGKTTFYGTYSQFNNGAAMANGQVTTIASNDVLNSMGATANILGSKTTVWGMGVTQAIDAAAMNLFLGYVNTGTSGTLGTATGNNATIGVNAGNVRGKANSVEDIHVIYSGATIKF